MPSNPSVNSINVKDGRLKFKIDKSLWESLKKAFDSADKKEAIGVIEGISKTLLSFSQTSSKEHKAYALIYLSFLKTFSDVSLNHYRVLEGIERSSIQTTTFLQEISKKLGSGDYNIDINFFEAPHESDILIGIKGCFEDFIQQELNLDKEYSNTLGIQFASVFIWALHREWQQNSGRYKDIEVYFEQNKTPFSSALSSLAEKEKRHAELVQRFLKPFFPGATVSLSEIYVSPHFWVHRRCIDFIDSFDQDRKELEKKKFNLAKKYNYDYYQHDISYDLESFILSWLKGDSLLNLKSEKSRLLLLLGYPGQGKTSFLLYIAKQLLNKNDKIVDDVFLINLNDISGKEGSDLLDKPSDFIFNLCQMRLHPNSAKKVILIDGLDELYIAKGLSATKIQQFLLQIYDSLKKQGLPLVYILVTSRSNYIKLDSNESNYNKFLVLHFADLSLEQQVRWVNNYQKFHTKCWLNKAVLFKIVENRLKNKVYERISEILSQPSLLHMVASMEINELAGYSGISIYNAIIEKLIKRDWSEDGPLPKYSNLRYDHLRRFLQKTALFIFQQSEGRKYILLSDFDDVNSSLKKFLNDIRKNAEMEAWSEREFTRELLINAHIEEICINSEEEPYAYELSYKLFEDYLVACELWEILIQKKIDNAETLYKIFSDELKYKITPQNVADFIFEVGQQKLIDDTKKFNLKGELMRFMPQLINQCFLVEHRKDLGPSPIEKIIGLFYFYWCIVSAMIEVDNEKIKNDVDYCYMQREKENLILNDLREPFSHLLILLQRIAPRQLKLCFQNLSGSDFQGINLSGTSFQGAVLSGVNFNGAKLHGCDFRFSDLSGADLSNADLEKADFRGANLTDAQLPNARLAEAKFKNCNIRKANFTSALFLMPNLPESQKHKKVRLKDIGTSININAATFAGTVYESAFNSKKGRR